jgi:hypothetical protein
VGGRCLTDGGGKYRVTFAHKWLRPPPNCERNRLGILANSVLCCGRILSHLDSMGHHEPVESIQSRRRPRNERASSVGYLELCQQKNAR